MIQEKCGKMEELNQQLVKQESELAFIYTKYFLFFLIYKFLFNFC